MMGKSFKTNVMEFFLGKIYLVYSRSDLTKHLDLECGSFNNVLYSYGSDLRFVRESQYDTLASPGQSDDRIGFVGRYYDHMGSTIYDKDNLVAGINFYEKIKFNLEEEW